MGNVKRVKTGIRGFDELIEGGIPAGFNVLITGGPGTGKTIFGLQYIYNGATDGEPGVYVSLESSVEELKEQASEFGWDLNKLEKKGTLIILKIPLNKTEFDIFGAIEKAIKQINAKRLVFDSLVTFSINFDQFKIPLDYQLSPNIKEALGDMGRVFYDGKSRQRTTYLLLNKLQDFDTTNVVITAAEDNSAQITVDGVSEYACDMLVYVYNDLIGTERVRTLAVLKMRNTEHSRFIHDLKIDKKGIIVKPSQEVYK